MKNSEILFLANNGLLLCTATDLDAKYAYTVFKFKRFIKASLKVIQEKEELLKAEYKINNDEVVKTHTDKYNAAFIEMLNEVVEIKLELIPYEQWHLLQRENKKVLYKDSYINIFNNFVEELLEGVLWGVPSEE